MAIKEYLRKTSEEVISIQFDLFYLTVLAIAIFALSGEVSAQRWCRGVSDHRCLVDPCIGRKIIRHIRQNNDIPFPKCCARNICGKSTESTTKSSKRW